MFAAKKPQIFEQSELQAAGLALPIVIRGTEHFRARRVASLTNDTLFGVDSAGNSLQPIRSYFASDLSNQTVQQSLLSDARGGSLFAKSCCVALYETEGLRSGGVEQLVNALTLKRSQSFFIIVSTADGKANKLLDALNGEYLTVAVPALEGAQLAKWSQKELERCGHRGGIELAALEVLVRSFGENSRRLSGEISKLSLLVSQDRSITVSDVEELLLQKAEHNTFSLIELMAAKSTKRALSVLHSLYEQGMHPLQIISLVSKGLRSILAAKNPSSAKLHSDISNPWILKNIPQSKRLFSEGDLKVALQAIGKLDSDFKGSKRESEELLEDFVVNLSSR